MKVLHILFQFIIHCLVHSRFLLNEYIFDAVVYGIRDQQIFYIDLLSFFNSNIVHLLGFSLYIIISENQEFVFSFQSLCT